jgi:hypothetical protein
MDKNLAVVTLKKVTTALKVFQKCFQQQQHCWAKCIAAQWDYFKGDPSQ